MFLNATNALTARHVNGSSFLSHITGETVATPEHEPPAIDLRKVSVHFGSGQQRRAVLDNLDFAVDTGEQVLVQGASGSGKTTMLNVVRGIQTVSTGSVRINGEPYARSGFLWSRKKTGGISYVPQHLALPTAHRLATVATLQARMGGIQPDAGRLSHLLEGFGLRDTALANPYVGELSGGQQARVAVIAQLMTENPILLLDEPASALDHDARLQFGGQLGETCRSLGATALVISHDPLDGFASREVTMQDGRISNVPAPQVDIAGVMI